MNALTATRLPAGAPAWLQELDLTLPVTAQYVLTGNVHDVHAHDSTLASTTDSVRDCLVSSDYDLVYRFSSLEGIRLIHVADGVTSGDFFPDSHLDRATIGSVAKLADLLLHASAVHSHRVALIIESASTLWQDRDSLEAGKLLLASRQIASGDVHRVPGGGRTVPGGNTIIWVAEHEDEAPDWLQRSDSTRTLRIPLPSLSARRAAARILLAGSADPVETDTAAETLAEMTPGITLRALRSIIQLATDQGVAPSRIEEAVRAYLAGVAENPWQDPQLLERIRSADTLIERRVLGQSRAVRRATDILLRSALGLTGAHAGEHRARPQGILFFAGPTGVGKTELAKTLAEVLFGSEDAYVRFDMSEFSAEHSDARLIGAPPGYIGHREGGELTNAVRERPFSVLLFDEIEKAHPRVLDKFLQILDDGRLTDGSGKTVRFGEAVIIFTSNLGATAALEEHVATSDAMEQVVRGEIERHFIHVLHRPELLSRLGDNLIVFDAIGEDVARTIITRHRNAVLDAVARRHGVDVTLGSSAVATIERHALNRLRFGARGLGAAVEGVLVNPLARALADGTPAGRLTVADIVETAEGWALVAECPAPHP